MSVDCRLYVFGGLSVSELSIDCYSVGGLSVGKLSDNQTAYKATIFSLTNLSSSLLIPP
jgi:hypothetical protein